MQPKGSLVSSLEAWESAHSLLEAKVAFSAHIQAAWFSEGYRLVKELSLYSKILAEFPSLIQAASEIAYACPWVCPRYYAKGDGLCKIDALNIVLDW